MSYQITNGRFHAESASGVPLSNGRLYTYVSGTTTFKATYTDGTLATPNTYTNDGAGGLYIALNARGEAQVWLGTGSYTLTLKDSSGVTVWTVDNIVDPAGATAALQTSLAGNSGSSQVGFIQPYTGSVLRSVQDALRDDVRIRDVGGAACDDVTDDTAAIQAAINGAAIAAPDAFDGQSSVIVLKFPTRAKVYIAGTLYLPSFVRIDLNGARLRGNGANTCFESGYWSGGTVVSNFGQPNETKFSIGAQVRNGQLLNFNKGFRLFNFCEDSIVENIRFIGCNQAVYALRCFYGTFSNLHSRTPLDGTAFPCYHFDDSVNAITIQACFAVSYTTGWKFSNVKQNAYVINCGAESCPTGVLVTDPTASIQFHGWYFEGDFNAINFDAASGNHENVYVSGCWFNGVTNAIQGATIVSGEFSQNNKLNGAAVNLPANFSPRMWVDIPTDTTATNAVAALPTGYNLGDTNLARYVKSIYNSGSGLVTNKARIENGVIPFYYSGTAGIPNTGTVPFGTVTVATTTITVDMPNLSFTNFDHYVYALVVTDNGSSVNLSGRVAFGTVQADSGFSTKTVTASANAGKLRLVVSGLTLGQACTGLVRLM